MMAPEGRNPALISIVVASGLTWWLGTTGAVSWCLPLLVFWLYRDPQRTTPAAPLGIISPIDGKVVSIDTLQDVFLSREAIRIRIKPGMLSSFVIRSATEGKVMQYWLAGSLESVGKGAFNKRCRAVWLQTDEEDDVVIVMQASAIQQLHCRVSTGERIGQGQRCGFLLFARQVDVYLAVDTRIDIHVGDKVCGGESVLAQLIHRQG